MYTDLVFSFFTSEYFIPLFLHSTHNTKPTTSKLTASKTLTVPNRHHRQPWSDHTLVPAVTFLAQIVVAFTVRPNITGCSSKHCRLCLNQILVVVASLGRPQPLCHCPSLPHSHCSFMYIFLHSLLPLLFISLL